MYNQPCELVLLVDKGHLFPDQERYEFSDITWMEMFIARCMYSGCLANVVGMYCIEEGGRVTEIDISAIVVVC